MVVDHSNVVYAFISVFLAGGHAEGHYYSFIEYYATPLSISFGHVLRKRYKHLHNSTHWSVDT